MSITGASELELRDTELDEPQLSARLARLWATPPGILGRLASVDHKVVGRRYIVTAFVFLMLGGILAALIDLAGDYAIAAKLGRGVPTIDMRIDYHRTALPGPLVARANVIKIGSTLATAEAQVFDNSDKLIASGRGAYLTQSR